MSWFPEECFRLCNLPRPCFICYTRPSASSSDHLFGASSRLMPVTIIVHRYLTLGLSTSRLKISQACHIHTITFVIPCFHRISIRPILKVFRYLAMLYSQKLDQPQTSWISETYLSLPCCSRPIRATYIRQPTYLTQTYMTGIFTRLKQQLQRRFKSSHCVAQHV